MARRNLTAKQEAFAQGVAKGMTHVDAYRAAYPNQNLGEASFNACVKRNMEVPAIRLRIAELQKPAIDAVMLDAQKVMSHWAQMALADPNDLVRYRWVNCRHCHGVGHAYQWKSQAEWMEALRVATHTNAQRVAKGGLPLELPTFDGGDGFRFNAEPHKHCPECLGEGIREVWMADTAKVKGPARLLYKGVRMTKNGPEMLLHDPQQAMANLAKALGLQKEVHEHRGALAVGVAALNPEQAQALNKFLDGEF